MTKQRHCFVTQVGDAVEALASALDPEREPPFKGDILDLLEWAEKDVLELRQQLAELQGMREEVLHYQREFHRTRDQLDAVSEEFGLPKGIGPAPGEIKRILSELRQQLASALAACKQKDKAFKEISGDCGTSITVLNRAWSICARALTIQPDDSALEAWCYQLRQQLAEKDAEIVELQRKLGQKISSYNTFEQLRATEFRLGKASRNTEVAELKAMFAELDRVATHNYAIKDAEVATLRETLCSVSTSLPAWQQKKVMDVLTNTK